jgi:hypothetical protein
MRVEAEIARRDLLTHVRDAIVICLEFQQMELRGELRIFNRLQRTNKTRLSYSTEVKV